MKRTRRLNHSTLEKYADGMKDQENKEYIELLIALASLRKDTGLTQSELAKRSGLAVSMISKIEACHSTPSMKTMIKYAKGLGVKFVVRKIEEK